MLLLLLLLLRICTFLLILPLLRFLMLFAPFTYLLNNKSRLLVRWRVSPQIWLQFTASTRQDGSELLKVCWRFLALDWLYTPLGTDSKNQAELRMVKLSTKLASSSSPLQLSRPKQPSTDTSLYLRGYLSIGLNTYCGRLETLPAIKANARVQDKLPG